jgi:hypothetical protein
MRAPRLKFARTRRWAAMPGDDARRFCEGCSEHVHYLSAMEPSAAAGFVARHPDACLRFAVDGRGRVVFRSRRLAVVATMAALGGCAGWDEAAESTPPTDELWARDDRGADIPDAIDDPGAVRSRAGDADGDGDAPRDVETPAPARRDAEPRSIEAPPEERSVEAAEERSIEAPPEDEARGRRIGPERARSARGDAPRRKFRNARRNRRARVTMLMGVLD